jgi:hypothetical protein
MSATIATELRALIPQMQEDAELHRSWTTEAAKEDMQRPSPKNAVELVGDAEHHARWAAFYDRCADVMTRAAVALENGAAT